MKVVLLIFIYFAGLCLSNKCQPSQSLLSTDALNQEMPEHKVLLLTSQGFYVHYLHLFKEFLEEITDTVHIISKDYAGEVDVENIDTFEQIWVIDLTNTGPNLNAMNLYDIVAGWWDRKVEKNIIIDTRIIFSTAYPITTGLKEQNLLRNYYENLKVRGGGLLIGTDGGDLLEIANYLASKIGLSSFEGSATFDKIYVPLTHPLIWYPSFGYRGIDDTLDRPYIHSYDTIAVTIPSGLQSNGIFLYTVGEEVGGDPKVTTSIPPSSFTVSTTHSCEESIMIEKGKRFEIEIGELNLLLDDEIEFEVIATSNVSGPYFTSNLEGEMITIDAPPEPGKHDISITLSSSDNQHIVLNQFFVTINHTVKLEGCRDKCSCDSFQQCNIKEDKNVTNIVNTGDLKIDPIKVTVEFNPSNPIIIDSTEGSVEFNDCEFIIIVPNEYINEENETEIDLLRGKYTGNIRGVTIQPAKEISCKDIESKLNFEEERISAIFSLKGSCMKWWIYLLIALGALIVIVVVLIIVVMRVPKLKSRFMPFSSK